MASGSRLEFNCLDSGSGHFTAGSTVADVSTVDFTKVNPVTGPIYVDGAMMNAAGRAAAAIEDIDAAVTVFYAACLVMTSAFAFGFLLLAAL